MFAAAASHSAGNAPDAEPIELPARFNVLVGDLAYADGGGSRWDRFGRLSEQLAASVPFMVMPGNHEVL